MDAKTSTKTVLQLAIEAAGDFGFAVETDESGLLRVYDPDEDYIYPEDEDPRRPSPEDDDGDHADYVPPEIIIAACRTNAWQRGFFKNDRWRHKIMDGHNAGEAALEFEEEFRRLVKVRRLAWDEKNVSNDALDEILRLVKMIKTDRAS